MYGLRLAVLSQQIVTIKIIIILVIMKLRPCECRSHWFTTRAIFVRLGRLVLPHRTGGVSGAYLASVLQGLRLISERVHLTPADTHLVSIHL